MGRFRSTYLSIFIAITLLTGACDDQIGAGSSEDVGANQPTTDKRPGQESEGMPGYLTGYLADLQLLHFERESLDLRIYGDLGAVKSLREATPEVEIHVFQIKTEFFVEVSAEMAEPEMPDVDENMKNQVDVTPEEKVNEVTGGDAGVVDGAVGSSGTNLHLLMAKQNQDSGNQQVLLEDPWVAENLISIAGLLRAELKSDPDGKFDTSFELPSFSPVMVTFGVPDKTPFIQKQQVKWIVSVLYDPWGVIPQSILDVEAVLATATAVENGDIEDDLPNAGVRGDESGDNDSDGSGADAVDLEPELGQSGADGEASSDSGNNSGVPSNSGQ